MQCALSRLPYHDPRQARYGGHDTRRHELENRTRELLAQHRDSWLGDLWEALDGWEFQRGLLQVTLPDHR